MAQRELNARQAYSELTQRRVYELILDTTDDADEADKQAAAFTMSYVQRGEAPPLGW